MKTFVIAFLIGLTVLVAAVGSRAVCADAVIGPDGAAAARMPKVLKTLQLEVTAMGLDRVRREIVARNSWVGANEFVRISAQTLEITATAELPYLVGGTEMVIDPLSGRVFMAGGTSLWVLARDGTPIAEHTAGSFLYQYLAIDAKHGQVYAVRNLIPPWGLDSWLDVISVKTGELVATRPLYDRSERPVIDRFSGSVWVTSSKDSRIVIFDPDTFEDSYIDPLPGGYIVPGAHVFDQSMVMIPRSRRAYQLANDLTGDVYEAVGIICVFDIDREVELEPISLMSLGYESFSVERIAANQWNNRLYVTMADVHGLSDPTVVVVNTIDGSLREIELPHRYDIRHIAVDEWRRRILVAASSLAVHSQILVLDSRTDSERFLGEIQLDGDVLPFAELDRRTGRYFVATLGGLVVTGDRHFFDVLDD